jgi:phosphoribosylamine-glycine ligase
MPMSHFAGQNIWILKPTGQNRGKGIHVVNSIKKVKRLIKDYMLGREYVVPAGTNAVPSAATMTQKAW